MKDMSRISRSALSWNGLEAIIYQLGLLAHQSCLFNVMNKSVYGQMGIIFSMVYLIANLANLGFDTGMGSWWLEATKSKQSFKLLVWYQFTPQIMLIFITVFIASQLELVQFFLKDLYLGTAVATLCLSESLKKTLLRTMYLSFANRFVALVELLNILTYIALVWWLWYYNGGLTLLYLFVPMTILSCCVTSIYFYKLWIFFKSLPSIFAALPSLRSVASTRAAHWANQLIHLLFSGNALVPLLGLQYGIETAGTFKLVSSIAQSINSILYKTFGLAGHALFCHIKTSDQKKVQSLFYQLSYSVNQVFYILALFLFVGATRFLKPDMLETPESIASFTILALFAAILISESFFSLYESFLMAQNKIQLMVWTQLSVFVLFCSMAFFKGTLLSVLGILFALRIAAFSFVAYSIIIRWHLSPSWHLNPRLAFCGAVIAGIALLCVW